jgi:hypothetical protein
MDEAYDAWEPFAIALLANTATNPDGTTTYGRLSTFVQAETGITHNALLSNWIGGLLARVIDYCQHEGTPHLSSLCVKENGSVGDGFRWVLDAKKTISGNMSSKDLDDYAAKERIECYRYFGVENPSYSEDRIFTTKVAAAREARRARERQAAMPTLCKVCHTQLPNSGVCYYCE